MIGFLTYCAIAYIYKLRTDRMKKQSDLSDTIEKKKQMNAVLKEENMKQNYRLVHKAMFETLSDVSEILGIKKPDMFSEIEAIEKYYVENDIYYYNFSCLKKHDIDLPTVKMVLQTRIRQKLEAKEIPLTPSFYAYESQTLPIMMIHDLYIDGNYLHIKVVLVDALYIKQKEQQRNQIHSKTTEKFYDDLF